MYRKRYHPVSGSLSRNAKEYSSTPIIAAAEHFADEFAGGDYRPTPAKFYFLFLQRLKGRGQFAQMKEAKDYRQDIEDRAPVPSRQMGL